MFDPKQEMVWVSVWLEGKRSLAVMETLELTLPKCYLVELQSKQERFLKVRSVMKYIAFVQKHEEKGKTNSKVYRPCPITCL